MRYVLLLVLLLPVPAWAAAPTYIQQANATVGWLTLSTASRTTSSFSVQVGDVLACYGVSDDQANANFGTNLPTNTGTAFTWTPRAIGSTASYTGLGLWTTTTTAAQSMTVSYTVTGADPSNAMWSLSCLTFRASDGVGDTDLRNVASGTPATNALTTTQANSAVVFVIGDWAAVDGASRDYLTNAGAESETTYARDSGRYTVYAAYHADAGAATTVAVGLSTPGSQKYVIGAVEIKGTGGAASETFGFRLRRPE